MTKDQDIFSLIEDQSLNYYGVATMRGVVLSSSFEISSKRKVASLASQENRIQMEITPISLHASIKNPKTQKPLNRSDENDLACKKKQKIDPKLVSSSGIVKSSLAVEPSSKLETLFVKLENLPLSVSEIDIRRFLMPLKVGNIYFSILPNRYVFDCYVVFETEGGAILALQRSKESIVFRDAVHKEERIVVIISSVSELEATWAVFTSFRSIERTKDFPNVLSMRLREIYHEFSSDESISLLWEILDASCASKYWMTIYNECNDYGDVVDNFNFNKLLFQTLDIKHLPSNERIIHNTMFHASNAHIFPNDRTTLKQNMQNLSICLLRAVAIQNKIDCDESVDDVVLQSMLSWFRRVRKLLECLYILLWKVDLIVKTDDLS